MNVEFLTNRINTATAKPVESFNYEPTIYDATVTNPDPIVSSTHSSPQYSNANYSHNVDDNANYAINNTPNVHDTPSKTLLRSTSIKYSNDVDDEPNFSYNETPSYVEPTAYVEPPGKAHQTHETDDQIKIQHSIINFHHIHQTIAQTIRRQNKHFSFSFFLFFVIENLENE